jgi:DNA-binding NtrC family response regulator
LWCFTGTLIPAGANMKVEISEPQTAYPVEGGAASRHDWRPGSLEEVRKQHIQRVLAMCKGNRLRAAQVLGIGRTSLYRYLKEDGYDQNVIARAKAAAG